MLKTTAHALPTYVMGVFKLPRKVCNRLMAVMVHFWWAGTEKGNGTHWCSKERFMRKDMGGLWI